MASGDKFYVADKATLDEVRDKIGSTTDTGGSSTVGTVMAKENAVLVEVGKIGATNDAQSSSTTTGSIFAKLNYLVYQISAYLSSISSWVIKIGATTDTGGTTSAGTVMAKANAILDASGKILLDGVKYVPQFVEEANITYRSFLSNGYTFTAMALCGNYLFASRLNYSEMCFDIIDIRTLVKVETKLMVSKATINPKRCVLGDHIYYCQFNSGITTYYVASGIDLSVETLFTVSSNIAPLSICIHPSGKLYSYDGAKVYAYDVTTGTKIAESTTITGSTANSLVVDMCTNGSTVLLWRTSNGFVVLDSETLEIVLTPLTAAQSWGCFMPYGNKYLTMSALSSGNYELNLFNPADSTFTPLPMDYASSGIDTDSLDIYSWNGGITNVDFGLSIYNPQSNIFRGVKVTNFAFTKFSNGVHNLIKKDDYLYFLATTFKQDGTATLCNAVCKVKLGYGLVCYKKEV